MDARKRPRSSTPTTNKDNGDGTTPTRKKSKKDKSKTKKTKKGRSNSMEGRGADSGSKPKNSMDSTATTDGQMMALMYSTFTKLEQSRFEAFQRASFRVDAIGDWVAACLSNRLWRHNGGGGGGGKNQKNNGNPQQRRRRRTLEDLVATGQAGEIRTVVAVLAKIYAQRLVQAAVQCQEKESQPASSSDNNNNNNHHHPTQHSSQSQPGLQPRHILRALEDRQALGLDPGFYLQPARERPVVESHESFDQKRLAALEAQQEYDRQQQQEQRQKAKSGDDDQTKDKNSMDTTATT